MRGTLSILILVAVIAIGLWYLLAPSDTPVATRSEPSESASDTPLAAGDSRTVSSDTAAPTDTAGTTDSGTSPPTEEPQIAGSGTTASASDPPAADAVAATATDSAQSTDFGTVPATGIARTAETGATPRTDIIQTPDSGTTDATERTAVAEPADPTVTRELVLAPAPEDTIERAPIGAPATDESDTDEVDDADILAAIGREIERMETAIRERLAPESGVDIDGKLRVQVTYDGSQVDTAQVDVEQNEAVRTPDSEPPAQAALATNANAGSSAGMAPDSATPSTADAVAATATDSAQSTDFGTVPATGIARTAETGATPRTDIIQTPDSGTTDATERTAVAEPADPTVVTRELVLAPAPEDTIERAPIGAPATDESDTDEVDDTDILVAIGREIERMETAIRERLAPESGVDIDGKLRVQVTYDGSQVDTAQVDVEQNEAVRTPDPDPPVQAALAANADAGSSAGMAPDSATPSTDTLRTADADPTPSSDVALTAEADTVEAEAKQYVETLTATTPQTIPVDKADHFVTQEHVLSLVTEDTIDSVSIGALAEDDTLQAEAPITVVREVEQIETAVPEQLIAESGGDLDAPLRVLVRYDDSQDERNVAGQDAAEGSDSGQPVVDQAAEPDAVAQITVREALERILAEPEKPLSIIKTVRYFEVMTLRELLDTEADIDALVNVVTRPYRIAAATLADLLQRKKTENPDTIFYLHTVQPTDEQGIWGIVHFGLIDNFARGIAIRRGEDVETYTVQIPRHADERLEDQSSSFLGKLIDDKTRDSFVYNFRNHRMGRNPDRIYPGQEIVIINFEPEELIAIYKHFAIG